ncbi:MAG: hypothetical protein KatS3mg092_0085 [Patescibacteria group bacterium]|nr:MAG: hypothetical protein KatS3mg092_0085 [Patescibacteria group bacterium]
MVPKKTALIVIVLVFISSLIGSYLVFSSKTENGNIFSPISNYQPPKKW